MPRISPTAHFLPTKIESHEYIGKKRTVTTAQVLRLCWQLDYLSTQDACVFLMSIMYSQFRCALTGCTYRELSVDPAAIKWIAGQLRVKRISLDRVKTSLERLRDMGITTVEGVPSSNHPYIKQNYTEIPCWVLKRLALFCSKNQIAYALLVFLRTVHYHKADITFRVGGWVMGKEISKILGICKRTDVSIVKKLVVIGVIRQEKAQKTSMGVYLQKKHGRLIVPEMNPKTTNSYTLQSPKKHSCLNRTEYRSASNRSNTPITNSCTSFKTPFNPLTRVKNIHTNNKKESRHFVPPTGEEVLKYKMRAKRREDAQLLDMWPLRIDITTREELKDCLKVLIEMKEFLPILEGCDAALQEPLFLSLVLETQSNTYNPQKALASRFRDKRLVPRKQHADRSAQLLKYDYEKLDETIETMQRRTRLDRAYRASEKEGEYKQKNPTISSEEQLNELEKARDVIRVQKLKATEPSTAKERLARLIIENKDDEALPF